MHSHFATQSKMKRIDSNLWLLRNESNLWINFDSYKFTDCTHSREMASDRSFCNLLEKCNDRKFCARINSSLIATFFFILYFLMIWQIQQVVFEAAKFNKKANSRSCKKSPLNTFFNRIKKFSGKVFFPIWRKHKP